MDDLISRQAAIDALCSECQGQCIPCESYPCSEVEAINALPSAQSEIIRCKDCKYQEIYEYNYGGRTYHSYGCELSERFCLDDDFCSRAERREE